MTEEKTGRKLETLIQVDDALKVLGYESEQNDDSLFVKVGGSKNPFYAVLIINEKKELVITCQLAKLGDFKDDKIMHLSLAALDANTRIRPFAYGMITDADTPELQKEEEWPFVLTDSMPICDLSEEELEAAMDSLLKALMDSREVLEVGLGN